MQINRIEGNDRGPVLLYALSTCGWCRKTKHLLNDLGVDYQYIDVDLLEGREKDEVMENVRRWNPGCSFPTLVINNDQCIVGYDAERIREALGG